MAGASGGVMASGGGGPAKREEGARAAGGALDLNAASSATRVESAKLSAVVDAAKNANVGAFLTVAQVATVLDLIDRKEPGFIDAWRRRGRREKRASGDAMPAGRDVGYDAYVADMDFRTAGALDVARRTPSRRPQAPAIPIEGPDNGYRRYVADMDFRGDAGLAESNVAPVRTRVEDAEEDRSKWSDAYREYREALEAANRKRRRSGASAAVKGFAARLRAKYGIDDGPAEAAKGAERYGIPPERAAEFERRVREEALKMLRAASAPAATA